MSNSRSQKSIKGPRCGEGSGGLIEEKQDAGDMKDKWGVGGLQVGRKGGQHRRREDK